MRTAKRELNPAITIQREAHKRVTDSLKDKIKSLEADNARLREAIETLHLERIKYSTKFKGQ